MKKGRTYLWVRKMMQGTNKRKAYYNRIPVYYCSACMSLKIMESEIPYCGDCGDTDIGECKIGEWLSMKDKVDKSYERD